MSALRKLAELVTLKPPANGRGYLSDKQNFMKVMTIGFGGPGSALLVALVGNLGGIEWWLFLVALAFGGGWIFAEGMWIALKDDLQD